jgi:hypothetical protein
MTDGRLRFFANATATALDISVLTAQGRAYFLKSVTPSQHRIDVNPHVGTFSLVGAWNDKASCTTVRPLGFALKKGMLIHDVRVQIKAAFAGAAAASNRYSVGVSGTPLGFIKQITCSSTGFKDPSPSVSTTGVFLANRYGSLLAMFSASASGGVDYYVRKNYIVGTAANIVVKRQTAATLTHSFTNTGTSGAGKGYIYFVYTLLPTEAT